MIKICAADLVKRITHMGGGHWKINSTTKHGAMTINSTTSLYAELTILSMQTTQQMFTLSLIKPRLEDSLSCLMCYLLIYMDYRNNLNLTGSISQFAFNGVQVCAE